MFSRLKNLFVVSLIFLVACTNASPVMEVKKSKFGETDKTLEELILGHPSYKKDTLIWGQTSPKEGLIVDCTYEISEGDGFIVAMAFEVTQKNVMMTKAQIFSKYKSDGMILHLEPEKYIEALEGKKSIKDASIKPFFINR